MVPTVCWNGIGQGRKATAQTFGTKACRCIWTKGKLLASLKEAGVDPNKDLLVHSAMSKIGYVEGGPTTVVEALRDALLHLQPY